MSLTTGSGADRLLPLVGTADLDLARLGLFGDRNSQCEHPGVVACLDPLSIEVVSQDELPAEHPTWTFRGEKLGVAGPCGALGLDRDHVAFHVNVDRVLADTG